jgi:multimeric flavodoxin WrbA
LKQVVCILGSPRKGKNTDILLDKVVEGLKEAGANVKKIYLKDLNYSPCIACEYCYEKGECFNKDDMEILYKSFSESDGIIVASPVYFNTVSSLTKIMIDRCQVYWSRKYVLRKNEHNRKKNKIGMFIGTGGAPFTPKQFEGCILVMDLFFKAIDTEYKYNLLASNTDRIPIPEQYQKLEKGYKIGLNFFK